MKSETFYKLFSKITDYLEKIFLTFIKAYLNTYVGQGMLKSVVNYAVDKLFFETIDPIIRVALVRLGYSYDVREGKALIEKLHKAKEEHNEAEYNSSVDDILGGM